MNEIKINSTYLADIIYIIICMLKYLKTNYSTYTTLQFISDNVANIDKDTAILIVSKINDILENDNITDIDRTSYNDTVEQIMIEHFDKKENK